MARVLGRIRLSRVSEESTSPERQRERILKWSDLHEHTVVGWAEDLGVSRVVNPLEAPDLRPWLNDLAKVHSWDILAGWKLDRIAMGSIYLNDIMKWCNQNQKTLVSVTENFDLSTWVGRMFANLIAGVAEGEWEAIRERIKQTYDYNVRMGKYRGGPVAFGYESYTDENGDHRLRPNPEQVELLHELMDRVLKGERPNSIVRDLNDRGIATPQSYKAHDKNKRGFWRNANLIRILTSPVLLGYAVETKRESYVNSKGQRKTRAVGLEPIRLDDGSPVIRAEPIVSAEKLERVREKVQSWKAVRASHSSTDALLTGVVFCAMPCVHQRPWEEGWKPEGCPEDCPGQCGQKMYLNHGRNKMYYRCTSATYATSCGNKGVDQYELEDYVTDHLLSEFGDTERVTSVYDPGEDHEQELADVNDRLTDLVGQIGKDAFRSGTPQRAALDEQIQRLAAKQAELSAIPRRQAGVRQVPTGETFADHWTSLNKAEKNQFLRDSRIRVWYSCPRKRPVCDIRIETLWLAELATRVSGTP